MSPHSRKTAVVILAAGQGTRMCSGLPKVLHKIGGLPMIGHVIRTAQGLSPESINVIVGHQAEMVTRYVSSAAPQSNMILQEQTLGTGHAVQQTKSVLSGKTYDDIFVLYGDTPLIPAEILQEMQHRRMTGADVVVLGFEAQDPRGYGRLVLGENNTVDAIVEAKDATEDQKRIKICNSGVMCIRGDILFELVDQIKNNNAKGEYYLTDIIALARETHKRCDVVLCAESDVLGVNSREELAVAETIFQNRKRQEALKAGVTMLSPETVYFSHDTHIAPDVLIEPNVFFGIGVYLESGVTIKAFSHLEGCSVAKDSVIGPFARLRPGTLIDENVKIGNFVEVKNTHLAKGAKVNHLSYIGDATVGEDVNIGAGTITCNYDGYKKHKTIIEDNAFIGSNSSLVAPVTIGKGSYVGSGSVVTEDIPEDSLAIARARQVNKVGRASVIRECLKQLKK
jgi:bifunctional UDP-N-acetylglucosamine pyrophosphorylase / glucosamine-1-phosphate N-acetyltransferase